jgi:hypothetical protein
MSKAKEYLKRVGLIQSPYISQERVIKHLEAFANEQVKAITVTRCCTELNPEFAIGEQVLLTKKTVVTIKTFCEDGMIEIDDNNEYYKVDKEELTKRV